MGQCQGVISQPDITFPSRTAISTGTSLYKLSLLVHFNGTLILDLLKLNNIFTVVTFYLAIIQVCAGVICDTHPTEGKHTGHLLIRSLTRIVKIVIKTATIFIFRILITTKMLSLISQEIRLYNLTVLQSVKLELSKYCHPS